jgi:hypothetical protein
LTLVKGLNAAVLAADDLFCWQKLELEQLQYEIAKGEISSSPKSSDAVSGTLPSIDTSG